MDPELFSLSGTPQNTSKQSTGKVNIGVADLLVIIFWSKFLLLSKFLAIWVKIGSFQDFHLWVKNLKMRFSLAWGPDQSDMDNTAIQDHSGEPLGPRTNVI